MNHPFQLYMLPDNSITIPLVISETPSNINSLVTDNHNLNSQEPKLLDNRINQLYHGPKRNSSNIPKIFSPKKDPTSPHENPQI